MLGQVRSKPMSHQTHSTLPSSEMKKPRTPRATPTFVGGNEKDCLYSTIEQMVTIGITTSNFYFYKSSSSVASDHHKKQKLITANRFKEINSIVEQTRRN
jgi:hypothetical protein